MYQVSRDCSSYRSGLRDMVTFKVNKTSRTSLFFLQTKSFGKLHKYFYELDESAVQDRRTSAAIAFMATNATAELMRSDLIAEINSELLNQ